MAVVCLQVSVLLGSGPRNHSGTEAGGCVREVKCYQTKIPFLEGGGCIGVGRAFIEGEKRKWFGQEEVRVFCSQRTEAQNERKEQNRNLTPSVLSPSHLHATVKNCFISKKPRPHTH